jgi:peptidoglycan/LPS O-acetylase OafA/YrhL
VRRLGNVPALDGLRGVAILLVLGRHANRLLPGGLLGVDLFFVLSGFLITSLLLNEWSATGSISLRAFWRRRALRLLPALGVFVPVVVATYALFVALGLQDMSELEDMAAGGAATVGYVANVFKAEGDFTGSSFSHTWSLSTEEQFYVLWPLVLVGIVALGARLRGLMVGLGAAFAALAIWRIAVILGSGFDVYRVFYAPDTRCDALVLGCLAGVAFTCGAARRVPPPIAYLALGLGAVIVAGFDMRNPEHAAFGISAFALAAALVLLACVLEPGWAFGRAMTWRPLRELGRISYGLYLWHVPVFLLVGWELGIPMAILVALASYRFIEQPFLRRKRSRIPDPALATAAGSAVAAYCGHATPATGRTPVPSVAASSGAIAGAATPAMATLGEVSG